MVFTIKELSELIKLNLPKDKINLVAEVREPKIRNGHMYLTLKDDNGYINCIIWKSNINKNILNLKEGDKINVNGSLSFYQNRCSLSFIINSLNSIDGKGELMQEYENLYKYFNDKGYFSKDNKLKHSKVIKKILILTSKDGAALQDFYYGLDNGNIKIEHELINVNVQGNDCPKDIIDYLENNNIDNYDLIVITRGGGSFEDLFGFCKKELIECIYKLKTPVLSAIGHQVDTTLLDYVADVVAPTPSLAAQYIVDNNKKYIDELNLLKLQYHEIIKDNINFELNKINNNIDKIKNYYENIKNEYYYRIKNKIKENLQMIERYENKYKYNDNIIVSSNNIILSNENIYEIIKNNDPIEFYLNGKVIKIYDYKFKT